MARNEDKWGRNEWEGRGIKRADEFTRTPRSAKTFLRDGNADRCSGIRTENKTDGFPRFGSPDLFRIPLVPSSCYPRLGFWMGGWT